MHLVLAENSQRIPVLYLYLSPERGARGKVEELTMHPLHQNRISQVDGLHAPSNLLCSLRLPSVVSR